MTTFRGTLELTDRPASRRPIQATVEKGQLSLHTSEGTVGSWALSEIQLARAVEGFTFVVDAVQMRMTVDEPDRFWSEVSATEQDLIRRLRPTSSWWRFWSAGAWREWWAKRRPWTAHRRRVKALNGQLTRVSRSLAENSTSLEKARRHLSWARSVRPPDVPVKTARGEKGLASVTGVTLAQGVEGDSHQLHELRRQRAALVRPPRPISPAWVPAAAMIFLFGAIGAGADDPGTDVAAAAPSAASVVTTVTTPPTTSPPTTSPPTTAATTATSAPTTSVPATTTTTVPKTTSSAAAAGVEAEGEMVAYFFEVGQGDATLLAGPDFTILIDAGRHDRSDVVGHLERSGVEEIDLLVGTHPHADHIGQFPAVLSTYAVMEVWMSGDSHTTQTYEHALDAIEGSEAGYHEPRAGETVDIGSARVEVVSPTSVNGNLDNGSIALRVVFDEVAFFFTGDAGADAESAMLGRGQDLGAAVLQVGHHGSSTSSSTTFLEAVDPQVAVYSAGSGNQYGHPHPDVIARLLNRGVDLYGTDVHGTVIVITDGSSVSVDTDSRGAMSAPPTTTTASTATTTTAEPEASACGPGQVDINTAGFEELQQIKHIGPDRADQILELRPFGSVDSMDRISGIAAARLADIKEEGIACAG